MAAVKNGEAVAVLADKDFLAPYVNDSNGELVWVGEPLEMGGGVGLAFRDSDDELRAKFDAAIQSMKDDGTLNPMIIKYFGEDSKVF